MKKSLLLLALFFAFCFTTKAQNFPSTSGIIPDNGPLTCFPINVTGVPITSGLVRVQLNITHPNVADLDIYLRAPDGTQIELSTDNGGTGDNYTNTIFSMTAPKFIWDGIAAPFSDTLGYKPEGCGGFNLLNSSTIVPNGTWQLCIQDDNNTNSVSGTLNSCSIRFGASNNNPMPSNSCGVAPLVCSFDSYSGITYPASPPTGVSACYSPDPGTGGPTSSCGFSIENNSWLQFIASATTVVLNVSIFNCSTVTSGVQFAVYTVSDCSSAGGFTYATGSSATSCHNNITGTQNISFTGLVPGNTYYMMVDGYAGNVCNYSINPVSGVSGTSVTASLPSGTTACPGDAVTLTAVATGATSFSWSSLPVGFTATGASVTVNPSTTTTYYVTANISSGPCLGSQTTSTTINVFNPVVTAVPALLPCSGGTSTLTLTNPPATGGYIVSTPSYVAEPHAGTNVPLDDSDNSGNLNIGFTFNYFGTDYTQFRISSNGFIVLGTTAPSTTTYSTSIPTATGPNNLIALAWADLDPNLVGSLIKYQTTGTTPNRKCVISFQAVPYWLSANSVTGQIILYETTNVVDIVCINIDDDGGDMTQGIENATGTSGYAVTGRNDAVWGCAASSTRFTPQTNTIVWSTGATNVNSITTTAAGNYTVTVNGCVSNIATVNIDAPFDLNLDADATLDGTDTDISVSNCSFAINATPTTGGTTGATITWTSTDPNFVAPAAGVYTYTAVPTQCSSYTYTASVTRSGCTVARTITVTCPSVTFTTDLNGDGTDAADQTLLTCATLNFNATLSPAAPNANTTTSYVWTSNNPAFVNPGNTPIYNGAVGPNYFYQVVITRGNCPPITRRFTLFCAVCPAPGILMANLPAYDVATNTTTITTCSATDPLLTWNATVTNCGGGAGQVDCTGGITYTWTLGGTTVGTSAIYTATATGTYQLTVSTGTCIKTRIFIVRGDKPNIVLPDLASCDSEILNATPTAGQVTGSTYTYTWYFSPTYSGTYTAIGTPSTTPTLTIGTGGSFLGTGFYAVKVQRDDFSPICTGRDTMQYTRLENPAIAASFQNASFSGCSPITLNLQDYITNFSPTATYFYNVVGSVSGTLTASPTSPSVFTLPQSIAVASETYTISIRRGAYCTSTTTITFNTTPPVLPTLADVSSCSATTVNATALNAQAGDVYSWGGPGGFTSASPIITVSVAGTYTVSVSRGTLTSCNRNTSFTFSIPAPPVVNTQLEYIACEPLVVNADPANANLPTTVYTWTNLSTGVILPSTTNTATLTPGLYSVKASNGTFCNTTRNFYVTCPALSITASYNAVTDLIDVAWTDTSSIELGFELQRTDNVASGTWATVPYPLGGTVFPANMLTFADANISKNTEYCYRVRYILPTFTGSPSPNYSAFSNIACAKVPKAPIVDGELPPYEYQLRGVAGNQMVTLNWDFADETYGFSHFDIYFGLAPQEPTIKIAQTDKNYFNVIGLLNGREYNFKVRAIYRASNDPYYFSKTITLRPSIILGQEELEKPFSFEVFPNPNEGEFEVRLAGKPSAKISMTMITVSGQVIMTKEVEGFNGAYQESLNMSELPSGLYFLQVKTDGETMQKKISIVR